MTLEQQALLAEAISVHNPGLIDPNRKRTESVGSDSTPRAHQQSPSATAAYSTGTANNSNNSATHRSPQARRASTSRPNGSPESSPYGQSSNIRAATAAYSAIPPLTTAALQQSVSSTPSPTAESPSGLRTLRMSNGPGSGIASAGTARMSKQLLSQRPPSQQGGTNGAGILGSPVQSQSQSHIQSQLPASLEGIEIGDRVVVESMGLSGYLRFVGTAEFKTGVWAGIELDTPTGKNDGSVNGVSYFTCRPKCGIFVLAAKIVKTELLLPFLPSPATSTQQPPAQEDTQATPPPINHAAQAAARITAGSRASKYIGVTASQLKQRNGMPQPSNSRLPSQQQQPNELTSVPTNSTRAPISSAPINPPTTSPTPTARTGLTNRLSHPGSKVSPLSQATRTNANNRSGSASTSPSSVGRPRTSPTPGRLLTSPRRLSSRNSDHSDSNASASVLSPNLLDQASLVQMAESPQGDLTVRIQQLQLDLGVAIAENNMLKTEMNQTKTQLEMTRLLEKRDLSYDERAFLSKSLGRGGIEERIGQELEDLHAMKAEWEKEKAAKDSEIKGITEKMTQAWLDAAKSQKEKAALIQERDELSEKLKELEENGPSSGPASEEHLALIDSLKSDLHDANEKISKLESRILELDGKSITDEDRIKAIEETLEATRLDYAEQLIVLERDRDDLQSRLDDLEDILKVTTDALRSKIEAALRDAAHSEEELHEVQARLEHESELRRSKESDAEAKMKHVEAELQESQSLLAKSEKLVKVLEEKAKDYESSIAKREQEIAELKLELEDLAGMVQSEEVDRMRKVWENEKKRLEEAVADDITVITGLRTEIQTLESNESGLQAKIKDLEASIAVLNVSKDDLESEVSRLQNMSGEAQEQFNKERSDLQAKVAESEKAIESLESETKEKIQSLEAIALTVESWKEQCEAMQFEMIQKTAKAEDVGLELAETQSQRDAFKQEAEAARREVEVMSLQLTNLEKFKLDYETAQDEKLQLLGKLSELEAALALSASASASASDKAPSATEVDASEPNRYKELEEEIAHLKKMVHDLTRENVAVGSENKKLMLEHDNLMEAHKHVETECLKLMDEVERLHSESLAAASLVAETEAIAQARVNADATSDASASQSQSVIRLEGLLKEKQALLDRLTQNHASEMRDLRQRYVELDRTKAYEIAQLNKELTELESLIESKIFHEADLEEDVQVKQKLIDRLQHEISDLKSQLSRGGTSNGVNGSAYPVPTGRSAFKPTGSSLRSEYQTSPTSPVVQKATANYSTGTSRSSGPQEDSQALFCEICEIEGHDIISCTAVFGSKNIPKSNAPVYADMEDDRPYCENCEEYGSHYTDECPNESLTYVENMIVVQI
ncbi:Kinesin protein 1B [Mortierella sp. AD011]|nr:Kinesin protein 1B [Mortierella sp. AD010]KAF9401079.1 Kinesin protein 1B [Mortierella sp. AD011]